MQRFIIESQDYSIDQFKQYLDTFPTVELAPAAIARLARSRAALEERMSAGEAPIYGVNTGFGRLSQVRIEPENLLKLQRNLILSHAVGVGPDLPPEIVRLAMLLKLISFAKGYSGVRPELATLLVQLLNADALPVVPSQGSVGASGDLAPLAHITLPLMGEGQLDHAGQRQPAAEVLRALKLTPLTLQAKEGLAMINGTQVSTAIGLVAMARLAGLIKVADIVGALSVDGLRGTPTPFRPEVQELKRHAGAREVAANLRSLLEGSMIRESHREDDDRVQDPYSLRCMPQIHGACREALAFATTGLVNEANSVSDNPLIFPDTGEIVSAGHFHGEMVAIAADVAAIGAAELGSISERRLFALLSGQAGLPPFLVADPGLNSGFMMLQVTAAALVSENKTLCHPASIDSIPTGSDQEDHVPMSTWANRKLLQIADNLEQILTLEYLAAVQAIDFHDGLEGGRAAMAAHRLLRSEVPAVEHDRYMGDDIQKARRLIRSGAVIKAVEAVVPLS